MLWRDKEFKCKGCDNLFTRRNACKSNIPKYCSRKCTRKAHEKKIDTCLICSIEFYPTLHGKRKQKTCSKDCGYKLRSLSPNKKKGKKYPHLQRATIKECRTCSKKFRAINDKHNRKQVYCTHGCYVKGNRVSMFEDSVFEFLSKYCNNLERQVTYNRWHFDFKIKDTKILIEADGSYWHSLPKSIERDGRKNKWCKDNGFELFRIDELAFYKANKIACQVIIDRMQKLDSTIKVKINGKEYKKEAQNVPF